jgi:U3 small nucleolar RNA-associated protein 15
MQSGLLSIKTRLSGQQKARERERKKEMEALLEGRIEEHDKKMKKQKGSAWKRRWRGLDFVGEGVDIVIDGNEARRRKKEKGWELDLRKGRYSAALDHVLATNDKLSQLTLFAELRHRSALRAALRGRDEVTLQPVLQWIYKNITEPRLVALSVEIAMNVLDIYSGNLGQSEQIDKMVERLHWRVRDEVDFAHQAFETKGMLDMLRA